MVNRNSPVRQRGYTLLEMAIVVLIFSTLTVAILQLLRPVLRKERFDITRENMVKIEQALAEYARNRGFLPCPSAPEDVLRGNARIACGTNLLRVGVVPFAEIGLNERDSTDGWGNPFTYVVSEAANLAQGEGSVHANCRTSFWIQGGQNINPFKARFCCRSAVLNQVLIDSQLPIGVDLPILTQLPGPTPVGLLNQPAPQDQNAILDYVAYAVVSHGPNGEETFAWGQAARRLPQQAPPDNREQENSDTDNVILDLIDISPKALGSGLQRQRDALHDDIVLWRTQRQMIASNGMDSCNLP